VPRTDPTADREPAQMLAQFERVRDDVRALRACGRAYAARVTTACDAWATTCVPCVRDDVRVLRAWVTAACGAVRDAWSCGVRDPVVRR